MFEFTDDYKTGISDIDKEHEHFFEILNEAVTELHSNSTPIPDLAKDLLDTLKNYASMHFTHKEEYTENIQYLLDWLTSHILNVDCLISKWQKEVL